MEPPVPRLIHAANPGPLTGAGNNTWLLDGGEPALVDAGVGRPDHVRTLRDALAGRTLERVLVTHGHRDHVSGIPALRREWPNLEAFKFPPANDSGCRALVGGDRVRAGDAELIVLHTPGHAPDHVCFWDPVSRNLFAGDMVLEGTTVMIPAGEGGSLRDYMASLERILALEPLRIFPGHGRVVEEPARRIQHYLAHRREREQEVLAIIALGVLDADAIVDRIYPKLAVTLRPAARLTVRAHLDKLREEGRLPEA